MTTFTPGDTLRILLISTQPTMPTQIEAAIQGRLGRYRFDWVSQPELAVTRARDLVPHLIIVDDELGGARSPLLISELIRRIPEAVVLALVHQSAISEASQAVLAGARGFATKPLQPEGLVSTIQQALSLRPSHVQSRQEAQAVDGRIIVFCAPKGGTGRTTLAINTAVSLRRYTKQPVVLVDADYAAPALDVALNLHGAANIADLLPRLTHLDEELISGVLATHVSGVRVLLAPPPADLTTPITLPQVQQVLAKLKRMFPLVIVDLGLPMDETAFAFLDGADRIVMSVLPEMVGLRNTRLMLDQLLSRGYPENKVWLVLNRASMRGGVPVRDIERRLRVKIKFHIPDDQPLATYSVNRGVPSVMSHPRSAVSKAFSRFAQVLSEDAPSSGLGLPASRKSMKSPTDMIRSLFGRLGMASA